MRKIKNAHHAGNDTQPQHNDHENGRVRQHVKQKRQNRIHPALAPIDTGKQMRETCDCIITGDADDKHPRHADERGNALRVTLAQLFSLENKFTQRTLMAGDLSRRGGKKIRSGV
jgi:hypothetical protein